jgi:alpha-beta hydrolase superfamily lysophospholipase
MRHSRLVLISLLLAAALAFTAMSWLTARWHAGPVRGVVGPVPASFPYPVEDVAVKTDDGILLRGWYVAAAGERTAIVLLHGRGGTRLSMLDRARFLREAGYGCLLYDARAHGESGGDRCGLGALETADLRAMLACLRQRGVERIGCQGFSQGAATILLTAPDLDGVRGVVVESSFATLRLEIDHAFRRRIGLPGWLAGLLYVPFTERRLGVAVDDVRPIDHIAQLGCPVMVIGGTLDRSAYAVDTRALYEAAHQPKELWLVEGAEHEDFYRFAPREYEARVLAFLARSVGPPGS